MAPPAPLHQESAPDGDPAAFAALLRAAAGPLLIHIRAKFPQRWRGKFSEEDVLQETFKDAFLSRHGLGPIGEDSLLRWLKRVADNNIIDAVRGLESDTRRDPRQRPDCAAGGDSCTGLILGLFGGRTQTTPSQYMSRSEVEDAVRDAVALLPPDYKVAIEMYDLAGRQIGDVAAQMGRSEGAVHMLRKRAQPMLRHALAKKLGLPPEMA